MSCTDIAKYFPLFPISQGTVFAVPRQFCFGIFCPKVKAWSVSTGPQPMGSTRNPSEAGCVGRGGAREHVQFSPQGENGTQRTLRRRGFGEAPQQAFWQAFCCRTAQKFRVCSHSNCLPKTQVWLHLPCLPLAKSPSAALPVEWKETKIYVVQETDS